MSGIERDKQRIKQTAEVFTPNSLVRDMLNKLPREAFTDPNKSFLDPTCGDGQFLAEIVIRKVMNGATYGQALATVYGADLMPDNCLECIRRLYGVYSDPVINELRELDIPFEWRKPGVIAVYEVNGAICNIVCADGLKYDYSFGE